MIVLSAPDGLVGDQLEEDLAKAGFTNAAVVLSGDNVVITADGISEARYSAEEADEALADWDGTQEAMDAALGALQARKQAEADRTNVEEVDAVRKIVEGFVPRPIPMEEPARKRARLDEFKAKGWEKLTPDEQLEAKGLLLYFA